MYAYEPDTGMHVLATGIFYECGRDEAECYRLLDRLDREKPDMVLVEDESEDFGVVVSVRENTEKRASVSRFDIEAVRGLMKRNGSKSLMAKVVSVDFDERAVMLSVPSCVDCTEDLRAGCHASWQWDGPLMELPASMRDTRTAINVLDMALADGSGMDVEQQKKYLDMLAVNCRCDVSYETTVQMNALLRKLDDCGSGDVRAFRQVLRHVMLTLGAEERMAEFALWWDRLKESDEAFLMTKAWMDASPFACSNRQMVERIDSELVKIDLSLRRLPHRLYRNINNMGAFMHQMIYPQFTRDAIQRLFSELILREMLLERREEFRLTPSESTEASPDMSHPVWQAAITQGWIDGNLQPLLSRTQAALVAYYIADKLHIRKKWRFFEELWGRRNMKNDYYDALDQRQTGAMLDKIKKVMETVGDG